eukprot:2192955-Alexandrium_andersonii.AAC.1
MCIRDSPQGVDCRTVPPQCHCQDGQAEARVRRAWRAGCAPPAPGDTELRRQAEALSAQDAGQC